MWNLKRTESIGQVAKHEFLHFISPLMNLRVVLHILTAPSPEGLPLSICYFGYPNPKVLISCSYEFAVNLIRITNHIRLFPSVFFHQASSMRLPSSAFFHSPSPIILFPFILCLSSALVFSISPCAYFNLSSSFVPIPSFFFH